MSKIKTTVIGSFPKPDYLKIPDWFKSNNTTTKYNVNDYTIYYENESHKKIEEYNLLKAIKEVIELQDEIGIDVLTDGEVRREHYINYHLRHLQGIDFKVLIKKTSRNNAYTNLAPRITGKILPNKHFLTHDWKISQLFTKKNIKITIPGPMTIVDTFNNVYYHDTMELLEDLSKAINYEILDLVHNGCKYIQIDEPLFARKPSETLDFGIKYVEICFRDVPSNVCKIVHICCGYPDKLDKTDYPKADPDAYLRIAEALDNSCIDVISLEDRHRYNNLELFSKFKNVSIILGVIDIANNKIESIEDIKNRINEVLKYIPSERLIIAPDCGLAMLPKNICIQKLKNMVEAVNLLNLIYI